MRVGAGFDLILSSGFLCFASQAGFLQALDQHPLKPDAYVGTSSGALAAALAAAGLSAREVAAELSAQRPVALLRPSLTPWRGPCSTRGLVARLRDLLPPTFEELPTPLGVGVFSVETRQPLLLTSGDLPLAVAASCAVPKIFSPVGSLADGGAIDRTAVAQWRKWRPDRQGVVNLVSSLPEGEYGPRDGIEDASGLLVVRTPRSKASLLSLGDFEGQRAVAADAARVQLGRRLQAGVDA